MSEAETERGIGFWTIERLDYIVGEMSTDKVEDIFVCLGGSSSAEVTVRGSPSAVSTWQCLGTQSQPHKGKEWGGEDLD